jgi:hypothetical protein
MFLVKKIKFSEHSISSNSWIRGRGKMSEDEYNPGGGGEATKKPKESYFMYYFSV